jgi:hypothetical protein
MTHLTRIKVAVLGAGDIGTAMTYVRAGISPAGPTLPAGLVRRWIGRVTPSLDGLIRLLRTAERTK